MLALALPLALAASGFPAVQEGAAVPASARTVDERVAAEARAVLGALDAWAGAQKGLSRVAAEDGRFAFWTDVPAADARSFAKRAGAILARLDRALGPRADAEPLAAVLVTDPARYAALCDAVARAAPLQAAFVTASRETTGFTLHAPPLAVVFHDERVQQEARADHSLAHGLVHLELGVRFGSLPLWLAEGLACAGEDGAWGEVWAPWHRDGFVAARSQAEWRGKPTQAVVQRMTDLRGLLSYSADPFEEERARCAFAFATYGLDAQPEALGLFLRSLQAAHRAANPQGGRFRLPDAEVERLLLAAFGDAALARLQAWWKKPPKWNAKPR